MNDILSIKKNIIRNVNPYFHRSLGQIWNAKSDAKFFIYFEEGKRKKRGHKLKEEGTFVQQLGKVSFF